MITEIKESFQSNKTAFKMYVDSKMERFRSDTFLTKEPETLEWIRSFKPDSVFYDVGANIGIYSLYFASLYPKGSVYAFEPSRLNCERLRENADLNGFCNISAINVAVADKYGTACFPEYNEIGESGNQAVNTPFCGNVVFTIPLDGFIAPNYLKIDVDGAEWKIIQGSVLTLNSPALKSVLIEVDTKVIDEETKQPVAELIMQMLNDKGFRLSDLNWTSPHSRERREREGIGHIINYIFVRTP